jgi:Rieske 2Fe-2S family protein
MEAAHTTLSRDDYCSAEVFAAEQRRIFHAGWLYVFHIDGLPAGHRRTVDVAGESVIVARDREGALHAFANVCRHRGSKLCEPADSGVVERGAIRCPYHAWTYGLDGSLLATPRVEDDLDVATLGLWRHHVATWNGLVFVSLAADPMPLSEWLTEHTPSLAEFADLRLDRLLIGARTETTVRANWKIIVENYAECLHCAVVHPELVDLMPVYRTGHVLDPDRDDDAVALAGGGNSFTLDGRSDLSVLPGIAPDQVDLYRGSAVFPNVLLDVTGTSASLTALFPIDAATTMVAGEYLFAPDDVRSDDFDPSPVVDFNELVGRQDYQVCERVQRGVASSAFTSGYLTDKDRYVAEFVDHYRTTLAAHT